MWVSWGAASAPGMWGRNIFMVTQIVNMIICMQASRITGGCPCGTGGCPRSTGSCPCGTGSCPRTFFRNGGA